MFGIILIELITSTESNNDKENDSLIAERQRWIWRFFLLFSIIILLFAMYSWALCGNSWRKKVEVNDLAENEIVPHHNRFTSIQRPTENFASFQPSTIIQDINGDNSYNYRDPPPPYPGL